MNHEYLKHVNALKIKFAGSADHALNNCIESISKNSYIDTIKGKYKETRKMHLDIRNNIRQLIAISLEPGEAMGCVYVPDEHVIECIEIHVGGMRIDKISDFKLFPVLRNVYGMKGIPFYIFKIGIPCLTDDVSIFIEWTADVGNVGNVNNVNKFLFYDVHESICSTTNAYENYMLQIQDTCFETVQGTMKLPFNHPVGMLLIKSDTPCRGTKIKFKCYDKEKSNDELNLIHCYHINGYDVYKFSNYLVGSVDFLKYFVNFSASDNTIYFDTPDDKKVNVVSINFNVIRCMNNRMGVAMSK